MEHPLEQRVVMCELHICRLQSDYESEKRTRAEINKEIFRQLGDNAERTRKIENRIYMAIGALVVVSWVLQILSGHSK